MIAVTSIPSGSLEVLRSLLMQVGTRILGPQSHEGPDQSETPVVLEVKKHYQQ